MNTNSDDCLHEVEQWTVPAVLHRQSQYRANKVLLRIQDQTLSYAAAWRTACQVANGLDAEGLRPGEYVAVMLPNCMEYCHAWFGISRLGAVHVAINTDYMGRFLVHVLNNCRARAIVVHEDYLERLAELSEELEHLEVAYVVGDARIDSLDCRGFDTLRNRSETCDLPLPSYRDTGCVMYTSGTTGPSKGVLMPHAHLYLFGLGTIENMGLNQDDVFYIVLPLFHANGMFMQLYAVMIAGASAVVRPCFSASRWLEDIIEYKATITNSLGVVAAFVLNQPATPQDRNNRLRVMGLAPTGADLVSRLQQRFNILRIVGMYGMTEVNIPLYSPKSADKPDSCGRVWEPYFELKIVDPDTDEERQRGIVGEIVVRPKQPYGFMSGYLNMPEKTVEAWRNFWFHTGDAAFMDEDGDVYFVDRIKDCIRRRGENISSFEVENALAGQTGIEEVAVYAVASEIEGAEDEVMAAVVLSDDTTASIEKVKSHAAQALPAFAVPRYYRVMESLPKTPTGKIQKHVLRADGVTHDTVDTAIPR